MPVVVNREQFERLEKATNKSRNLGKHNLPQPPQPKPRYLFLKYKKDGKIRVKRLTVKNKIPYIGLHGEVIGTYPTTSRILKAHGRQTLTLELGQDPLEPLLQQVLTHLGADHCETVEYNWDDE